MTLLSGELMRTSQQKVFPRIHIPTELARAAHMHMGECAELQLWPDARTHGRVVFKPEVTTTVALRPWLQATPLARPLS
jgi:hypothetical protein